MILLAVGKGALADSMRFVLELEGYAPCLCDEVSLREARASEAACLVVDQSVFLTLADRGEQQIISDLGVPVILMVTAKTRPLMERAEALCIASVLEKPLFGSALIDEIERVRKRRKAVNGRAEPVPTR